MANITISTTKDYLIVTYGDHKTQTTLTSALYPKSQVSLLREPRGVIINFSQTENLLVGSASGAVVDSVDGSAPTNDNDLFDKLLIALKVDPKRIVVTDLQSGTWAGIITATENYLASSTNEYIGISPIGIVALSDEFFCIITEYN